MKLTFSIHYHTARGQQVGLCGKQDDFGAWDPYAAPVMNWSPGGIWTLSVDVPDGQAWAFEYKYVIRDEFGGVEWECGGNRSLVLVPTGLKVVDVHDFWRPKGDPRRAMYNAAFGRVVFRHRGVTAAASGAAGPASVRTHRFVVDAPSIPRGHVLALMGSDQALGGWDPSQVVPMQPVAYPQWTTDVTFKGLNRSIRYKYCEYDPASGCVVHHDSGPDRIIEIDSDRTRKRLVVTHDYAYRDPQPLWRGTGVNVPVFSLRSRDGLGVGEFCDIKRLVDWCRRTGIRLIQLLPVNDTIVNHKWTDSYPYAAISVFALHPIYMNLESMGVLPPEETRQFVSEARARLNALPEMDYEAVITIKSLYYKLAYDRCRDAFLASADFRKFFKDNRSWLVPYAMFSCLRDRYETCDFTRWPEYSTVDADALSHFVAPERPHHDDVAVHYFIQFHLHRQLKEAATYARESGIVLKGDIPIGVFRHSVDAWTYPGLFHMDAQAGAPPDAFAAEGQNWEFPTYNWEAMAADGYAWWRSRLQHLSTYFDAFRIDHVLGFFRIWEIPMKHTQGIMGHFSPALPVRVRELESRGIPFDYDRFCRPYVRQHLIDQAFGERAEFVRQRFFDETEPERYQFKAGVDTQRSVAAAVAVDDQLSEDEKTWITPGLLGLVANVLLLQDAGDGDAFHLRHSMQSTSSFRELAPSLQGRFHDLYVDFFYHRHDTFWRDVALRRLPAVRDATDMLICGEDLGMVPDCVAGVMDSLGLLGLFVERMPKERSVEFHDPQTCPYSSVCTPSTHDMSTVREWWQEARDATQRYYWTCMHQWGDPPETCEVWISRAVVDRHLRSPAMWAVFLLQDILGMSAVLRRDDPLLERINVPSNRWHYWRYRMHLPLEELLEADAFNMQLRELIGETGRLA